MNAWIAAAAVVFLAGSPAAGAEPGTTASDVFSFARSARLDVLGVGTALPGDVTALARNPAALAGVEELTAAVHYQDWYVDTYVSRASVAGNGPIGNGCFAVDVVYFSEGEVRDLDAGSGTYTDTYSNHQLGVMAGYGTSLPWAGNVDVGGAVQLTNRCLLDESASAVGASGGLAVRWFENALRAGVSIRNVSTRTELGDGDPACWSLAGGVSCRVERNDSRSVGAVACLDVIKMRDLDVGATVGGEIEIGGHVVLRLGYDGTTDDAPWRYGIGVATGRWRLDYALLDHDALGTASSISLGCAFGR